MGSAILNYDQYQEFQSSGLVPEFSVDDKKIPAYSMGSMLKTHGTSKQWKLFPRTLTDKDLLYLYQRCDIAANAVDIPARDTWSKGFNIKVYDDRGKEVDKADIVNEIQKIKNSRRLDLLGVFEEADIYSQIFGIGLVVIGVNDGKDLANPVGDPTELKYLTAYSKHELEEVSYIKDEESDDYGEPLRYELKLQGEKESFLVHRSRVIRVTEKILKKKVTGVSKFESCYDLFQVLKNIDWSAGEAYYQNASPLFVLSWRDVDDEGYKVDAPDEDELDTAEEDLKDINVKKRFIKPRSWNLEVVQGSSNLPDPGKWWDPLVERLSGGMGVPKQILLGTSAGALASGETNLQQYYKDIATRQESFAEPVVLDLFSRLQEWGILSEGNIDLVWESLYEVDAREKAEIQKLKIESAALALGNPLSGKPQFMTVEEVREKILGMDPVMGGGEQRELVKNTLRGDEPEDRLEHGIGYRDLGVELKHLAERVSRGYSREQAMEDAEELIDYFVNKAQDSGRAKVSQKLGRGIKDLSPENKEMFMEMKQKYLNDFREILNDYVEAEE